MASYSQRNQEKVNFFETPAALMLSIIVLIIACGITYFPVSYAIDPTLNNCVSSTTASQCFINAMEIIWQPPFSSIQIEYSVLLNGDDNSGGFSRLNTSDLNVFSNFLQSFVVNSTYPCYLQNKHIGYYVFKNCNIPFFIGIGCATVFWILFITFYVYRIVKFIQKKRAQRFISVV